MATRRATSVHSCASFERLAWFWCLIMCYFSVFEGMRVIPLCSVAIHYALERYFFFNKLLDSRRRRHTALIAVKRLANGLGGR